MINRAECEGIEELLEEERRLAASSDSGRGEMIEGPELTTGRTSGRCSARRSAGGSERRAGPPTANVSVRSRTRASCLASSMTRRGGM